MSKSILLEACVESAEAAREAEAAGADRIELCSNLAEGGLSPTPALIRACKKAVTIPVHVLIRPRSGDFLYSATEFAQKKEELLDAVAAGADGLVWGCLDQQGRIDLDKCRELKELSQGKTVTFHRAFDMSRNLFEALDDLISLKIQRVLTSGGQSAAPLGAKTLADLTKRAAQQLIILAGGGIGADNAANLIQIASLQEIHVSAMSKKPSEMQYQNPNLFLGKGSSSEYENPQGNGDKIRAIRRVLDSIELLT